MKRKVIKMYYSDKPILSKKEDFLKRKYFAELVAKSLENLNSQDTFTIGLHGQWGTGETSLVNMILEEIKENEKVVIVRFEPWNFSSTNQLLEQFFVHLANQFHWTKDKTLKEVGNALERYSDAFDFAKVIPHVGGAISFLGKRISKGIGKRIQNNLDKNDIMCQKEKVVQLLKGQNKRILVVIDDIDRLNNEQIRQVFQLITSVAKFPNMIYLLVFDKEIVVKALEKIQEGSGEEYLEKIIQMPIQIPDICSTEFRGIIFERLYNIVKEQEGIKINLEHWERLADTCVIPLLKNMRDVNRLCNLVQFKFSGIGTEVDFTDMVVISVIEMYYPTVYEWIKYNKNFLTGKLSGKRVYMANNKGQKELYDMYLNELKGVLVKVGKEKEAEKIMDILVCLFPYIGDEIGKITEWYDSDLLRRSNRIAHPDKFERYFDFNIEEIDIKSFEVTRAIQKLGCGELEKYILELNQEGKSYAFLSEIKSAIPNIREERAKIIVTSILKSAYKLEEKSTGNLLMTSSRDYAEHMVIDLFEQIEKVNRKNFLEQLINSGELDSLPSIAHVINIIELGYGRLAAEGREKSKGRIISIEELEDVEQVFKQKVKTILKENSIFDFFDYRMILYLMENFDSQFMTQRIQQELKDDIHILCFLKSTVFTWIGNGIKYAVSKEYEKYLTKERILDAIQNTQATGEMFRLSKKNQEYCAAFYLDSIGKSDDEGEVSQKDAERMIEKWRER